MDITFLLLMLINLNFCYGKCSLNDTIHTLEMISKHLMSTREKVPILEGIQDLDADETVWNFNKWSRYILTQPTADSKIKSLTEKEREDMKTATSVLTRILSKVLKDKAENHVTIITDLEPVNIFLISFQKQLSKDNIYFDIQTLTIDVISKMENIVLETPPNSINVLLLPHNLAQLILELAERNYLLTKEKKTTWIGFNLGQLQREYPCLQNIPFDVVLKSIHFDHMCNLQANETFIRDISNEISQTIFECEENHKEVMITTVIDEPFVKLVESEMDPLGRKMCINSLKCLNPLKLGNGTIIWHEKCCAGLIIEILQEINLNFHFKIYICPDGQYGGLDRNGNWTGMVNEVLSRRADIAMQGITVNTQRSKVVDFSEGFMLTTFGIIRRKHDLELPVVNWEFLKTLEVDLVYWLLGSFVLVLIVMFGYENLIYFAYKGKYYPTREAFSYVAGLTFQRDLAGKTPNKWSARLIAITYAIAMTIVMTTYTANLTANNITKTEKDDFKGMRDTRITDPTSSFIYAVRKGTSNEFYFKSSMQPRLRQVYNTFVKHYLTKTDQEGLDRVVNEKFDAYIGDYIYMLFQLAKPKYCSTLTIYKEVHVDFPLGFAVQKNSKWKYLLSQIIRDLRDSGKLQQIIKKWFYLPKCLENQAQANKFPWEYIGGMLLAVGIFVFISVAVMFVETCYTKRKEAKNTSSFVINGKCEK